VDYSSFSFKTPYALELRQHCCVLIGGGGGEGGDYINQRRRVVRPLMAPYHYHVTL